MQWFAESVWVSMFTPPGSNPDPYMLFSDCFGMAPDVVMPLEGVPPGKRVAKNDGDDSLVLLVRPGRIDIVIEPILATDSPPQLVDQDRALTKASAASERALAQVPILRLSCILNLMQLTPSQQMSAETFSAATGIANVDNNAQDLIFQRNLVARSAHGHEINQIVRWATTNIQFLQMTVTPGGPSTSQLGKQWFQVTKTLDYNTVPQQVPLAVDAATSAVRDLVDGVRSIMSKGE